MAQAGVEVAVVRRKAGGGAVTRPDSERLLASMIDLQEVLTERAQERIKSDVTLRLTGDKPVGIVFASDLHLGGRGTDHPAVIRWLERFEAAVPNKRHGRPSASPPNWRTSW